MWADWINTPHHYFYIKELAELEDGQFVIPMRWFTEDKVTCADVYLVAYYPAVCQSCIKHMFYTYSSQCS